MTFAQIIKKWPTVTEFGEDMRGVTGDPDMTRNRVDKWRARNSIPPRYWRFVIEAAEARGLLGVTLEALQEAAEESAENGRKAA